MESHDEKKRKTRRRRRGGNPPNVIVSNPAWNLTKPPPKSSKPNPAAGTGLFPGGRRKTRRRRRRGGAGPADDELFVAIQSKNVQGVKSALDRGADPNAVKPDDENTPLIEAVHTDEPELVQILIDAGARVDTKGSEGGTALYWAADNMPLNDVRTPIAVKIQTIIKILLKAGANPQLVYDALAEHPEALDHSKEAIERVRNPPMAIEVGVKKDLPSPLPSLIRGFLGSSRRRHS